MWHRLKMHSAQRALFPVIGRATLHYRHFQALNFEFALTESARKEASQILAVFETNHKRARQCRLRENHKRASRLSLVPRTLICRRWRRDVGGPMQRSI